MDDEAVRLRAELITREAELQLPENQRILEIRRLEDEVAALRAGQQQQSMLHKAECAGLEARITAANERVARHENSEAEAWAKYRELKQRLFGEG